MIQAVIVRHNNVRDVGFVLSVAGWIVVVFANSGAITGSLMIIFDADIRIAGLLAVQTKVDVLTQAQAQARCAVDALLPSAPDRRRGCQHRLILTKGRE